MTSFTSNISWDDNPYRPQYITSSFKDISSLLESIGTRRTLIIQDCEEAYTLLGSLLLMNQGIKYILLKDSIQLATSKKYVFVIEVDKYIYHVGGSTYSLRGKHVQQSP